MKKLTYISLFFFLLVTACSPRSDDASDTGDGSGSGSSGGSSGEANSSISLRLLSNKSNIETGGSEVANITAMVLDAGNRTLDGEKVVFSATGGSLNIISDTTGIDPAPSGQATAELSLAGDPANQSITVTATAGGAKSTVSINASGTTIEVGGPIALVAGDVATLTATLLAGNGEPISNEVLTFSSANQNSITPSSDITDKDGRVTVDVGSDAGDDVITVLALDGTAIGQHSINVADDLLTFETPKNNAELHVAPDTASHAVTVRWQRNGADVVGEQLRFAVTAGQILGDSLVTTGAGGTATVNIMSSSAGEVTVTVKDEADGDPATQHIYEYIATVPATLGLMAAPTVVSTNTSSIITAHVEDANGNPVKGSTVNFNSAQMFGGSLAEASAISNSDGNASVSFKAGNIATEADAISIGGVIAGNSGIAEAVTLTINKRELNVTLGSTDSLRDLNADTQYSQPYVVQVADGSGLAVKDATVVLSFVPISYDKGSYGVYDTSIPSDGVADDWLRVKVPVNTALSIPGYITCIAEDINGNGKLDPNEDNNGNGVLDPQNPAILAADSENTPTLQSGVIKTDANGSAFFALVYPQSNATWTRVRIIASVQAQNAEAVAYFISSLPVQAEDVDDVNSSIPNQYSPYGIDRNCSNDD